MTNNSPLAEYETSNGEYFRVIRENWSNSKNPTHPAVLERYDGSEWKEVDRWNIRKETESNTVETATDEEIISEAKSRINNKPIFEKDGEVVDINERVDS